MYRKKVLGVVFEYGLRMIGRIGECHVSVVEILLQPVRRRVVYEIKRRFKEGSKKKKDETRKSTPALPKASLSVVISLAVLVVAAAAVVVVVVVVVVVD